MDRLESQIVDLNHKFDQLHEIVEQISNQISALTADKKMTNNEQVEPISKQSKKVSLYASENGKNFLMEHKDILEENNSWKIHDNSYSEYDLSPEIQIRRLTAQLTAAYNRIATLEEQLLACRIQS